MRFWLRFRVAWVGGNLTGRTRFRLQPMSFSTIVEVDEMSYRVHYVRAFSWRDRHGDQPRIDDYWDLPYDFYTSAWEHGRCSLSGWITDEEGWRASDHDVAQYLLRDPRSIHHPPTWGQLRTGHIEGATW